MNKICVYTCITGEYDNLHEIENKEKGIDYYCFTNNKNIKSNSWKVIEIENEGLDNQRLSRKIKMLGHPIINDNYEISLWMDASVVFNKSIKKFINTYFDEKKASFSAFKHHSRNCIYEEANACIKYRKDSKENIKKHINFLQKENYPRDNGLYEMTVFIKKHNDPKVLETMNIWFDTICNYSKRDQLSFMYSVWKTKMKINDIPLNVWNNDWFSCKKHNYKPMNNKYRIYFGNEEDYLMDNDIQGEYKIENGNYKFKTKVPTDVTEVKLEIAEVPCTILKKITINGKIQKKYKLYNGINYKNDIVFYNSTPIIIISDNYHKGDIITYDIEMKTMNKNEMYQFIEYLSVKIIDQQGAMEILKQEKEKLQAEKEVIINSKGWQLLEKLRKIKPGK